jgi:hypothetical protein
MWAQICPAPPSTFISTPVMYEASWEARKATAAATSSGLPKRFIGTCFAHSSAKSCENPALSRIGVTIDPGATALTRECRVQPIKALLRLSPQTSAKHRHQGSHRRCGSAAWIADRSRSSGWAVFLGSLATFVLVFGSSISARHKVHYSQD